jgi:hypothetical protein
MSRPLYPLLLAPALLALVIGSTGCKTAPFNQIVLGPDYPVSNVFRVNGTLPPDLRRVAVLPLLVDPNQTDGAAGQQSLEPVLHTELLKTKRFELVWVSPEQLQQWTGKPLWTAEDKLPQNFLAKLREQTGCDAVLFSQLSRYHPYPPLILGWKLKLVTQNKAEVLWAVDEIFDAGEPLVSNSARRYEHEHQKGGPSTDSPMILASPQRFGHYTVYALLGTLPTP